MLRLFQAGLIAALIQAGAISGLTLVVLVLRSSRLDLVQIPRASLSTFLALAYLLIAIAVSLTFNRFVAATSRRIEHAASLMKLDKPDQVMRRLFALLWYSTVGFIVLELAPPPRLMVSALSTVGLANAAPIIWPGLMSLGVAGFGANALATWAALRRR
ncbi:hypothetical protein [Dongia sp.]|uniref:hypothetical protein n=1 Tax=Dongia sp. TaxID=1977262 RepID=UPI0035B2C070